ncbi:MAG: hypothetical protein IIY93_07900 [Clostridia bacterium]|nr:hypothetical protein [Clostridia bacterium]
MKNRAQLFRILLTALGILGMLMLIGGLWLRRLDRVNHPPSEKPQMPESYIEEFFSGENRTHRLEDYLEPEG